MYQKYNLISLIYVHTNEQDEEQSLHPKLTYSLILKQLLNAFSC